MRDEVEDKLELTQTNLGALSVGEVLLHSLKNIIEQYGVSVEFKLTERGAVLVCAGQVVIRKEGDHDFVLEGPPIPAYWEARKALYQHYAFI